MYTICPHCNTAHKVTAETLSSGKGVVRCASCHSNFDALVHLHDRLPKHATRSGDWLDEWTEDPASQVQDDLFGAQKRLESFALEPGFIQQAGQRPSRHWPWWLGSVLLLALMAGQWAWLKRDDLQRDVRWRPWLAKACRVLDCHLSPVRSPSDIVLLSRDVRPHPNSPGALMIEATLVNRAPWPVAYPYLEVALADLNDQTIALRRFPPSSYLADPAERNQGLAPNSTALVTLEVADPGRNAVAFRFEFR